MSQHPSLRSSAKDRKHRSVMKRYERIKTLKEKERWKDEDSVFGLPKVKIVKFKIKKEKAQAAEATAEGTAAAPGTPAAAASAAPAKGAAPAKAAATATPAKGAAKPAGGEEKKGK